MKTPALAMQQVYSLSKATYDGAVAAQGAARAAGTMRERDREAAGGGERPGGRRACGVRQEARSARSGSRLVVAAGGARVAAAGVLRPNPINRARSSSAGAALAGVMNSLQAADVPPTTLQLNAIAAARAAAARVMARWNGLRTTELTALNATLRAAGLGTIQP